MKLLILGILAYLAYVAWVIRPVRVWVDELAEPWFA